MFEVSIILICLAGPVVLGFSEGRVGLEPRVLVDETCTCGIKKEARIVNGQKASLHEYPWMVALCFNPTNKDICEQQICGGTLINDRYILTAAHCLTGTNVKDISVVIKEHNLNQEADEILVKVSKIIIHTNYDPVTSKNDIALIKLSTVQNIGRNILPVCLPPIKPQYNNRKAIITGWGLTKEGGFSSAVLREATVTTYSLDECRQNTLYKAQGIQIKNSMICAGSKNGGTPVDSCQGDSGGPLIFENQHGSYDQIGIVSFGIGCAREDYPGVYTRVNSFTDWIKNKTPNGVYCKRGAI